MASPGARDQDQRTSAPAGRRGPGWALRAARHFLASRHPAAVAVISVQAGLAAAAAWTVATDFLGRHAPVFAPVAALVTIAAAAGQRTRQTVELLGGVGLGIIVSDVLLYFVGTGGWQIAVVVASSVALGLLVAGRSGALVSQAGATATLFATVAGNQRNLELPRIIDTAVGTSIGFLAVALLLPFNPLRSVDRAAEPLFTTLITAIRTTAKALATGDRNLAVQALDGLNAVTTETKQLDEALGAADEMVVIAPWWRHQRHRFRRYRATTDQADAFTTDLRVLTRRAATLLEYHEPIPPQLHQAVAALGDALTHLQHHCATARAFEQTRGAVLEAASWAGQAGNQQIGPFGAAVALQVRSAASDVLRALGATPAEANHLVRDAATDTQGRKNATATARLAQGPLPGGG
jgi:uncharacterized membrane protein YgaE (UPF0421/DUF939 family)